MLQPEESSLVTLVEEEMDAYFAPASACSTVGAFVAKLTWTDVCLGGVLTAVSLVVCLWIHFSTTRRLRTGTSCSAHRGLYLIICRLAPVFCIAHTVAVALPKLVEETLLVSHMYVSVALWAFLEMLYVRVIDVGSGKAPQQADDVTAAFFLDPKKDLRRVVETLQTQPPTRFWAAPPLGCWIYLCPCIPCYRPAHASYRLLKFARHALLTYVVCTPVLPFLRLAVHAQVRRRHQQLMFQVLLAGEFALSFVALYALFIMYRLTHELLHACRTTTKFIAIKVLVLIHPLQQLVFGAVFGAKARWWESVCDVVLSVPLCLLLQWAYPPAELPCSRDTLPE